MGLFKPAMYKKNIFEINYKKLKEKGITCLVFDLDNTLGLIDHRRCPEETRKLIKKLGGNEKTIMSFAGFGDILLSCTSSSSRNYTYGKLLGNGESKKELEDIEDWLKNLKEDK